MAKKKKNGSVAIGFCLDESGSMQQCWDATISGFNEYVDGLRRQKGKTWLSLTKFSSDRPGGNYRVLCTAEPIETVPQLTTSNYYPDGNTPLYDAIGHTINQLAERLSTGEKPDSVLFVIQTDGQENSSREYTRQMIVKLIGEKEAEGWRFIYLGANQDEMTAERLSTGIGVAAGASVSYNYAQTDASFRGVAAGTKRLRDVPLASPASVASTVRDTIREDDTKKPKKTKR